MLHSCDRFGESCEKEMSTLPQSLSKFSSNNIIHVYVPKRDKVVNAGLGRGRQLQLQAVKVSLFYVKVAP